MEGRGWKPGWEEGEGGGRGEYWKENSHKPVINDAVEHPSTYTAHDQ